jgi:hypothetical protein
MVSQAPLRLGQDSDAPVPVGTASRPRAGSHPRRPLPSLVDRAREPAGGRGGSRGTVQQHYAALSPPNRQLETHRSQDAWPPTAPQLPLLAPPATPRSPAAAAAAPPHLAPASCGLKADRLAPARAGVSRREGTAPVTAAAGNGPPAVGSARAVARVAHALGGGPRDGAGGGPRVASPSGAAAVDPQPAVRARRRAAVAEAWAGMPGGGDAAMQTD